MKRIGLFGGSLDPVHLGHEQMAHEVLKCGIDSLIIMPCKVSPHKLDNQPKASDSHRMKMLQAVFGDDPRFVLSDYELKLSEVSYTWKTLEYLNSLYPDVRFALVIGYDQYLKLSHWVNFNQWSQPVDFFVFKRKVETSVPCILDINVEFVDFEPMAISSTKIREMFQSKDPNVSEFVSKSVLEVCKKTYCH